MATASLKSQAVYLFAGKVIAFVVMGVTPVILVRILSASQFGSYKQVLFIYAAVLPIIKLQMPESLYYFYPRKKKTIHDLLSQTLTMLFISGFLGASLFVFLGLQFRILPSGLDLEFVMPLGAYLFIETMAILVEHVFVLEKRPKLAFAANVAGSLVRLILIVCVSMLFKEILFLVYVLIVIGLLRLTGTLFYLLRKYPMHFGVIRKSLFKEQLKYTLPLAISTIIGIIGSKVDKGIISGIMTPEDFAIYAIGSLGIMNAVKILYISVGNVFMPRFGELAETNQHESVRLLWHKMVLMNAVVTLPIVTFCSVYAAKIISILYTPQYVTAANLWRLNMVVLLIQMLGFGYIPRAMGKTSAILTGNCVRFIISVSLSAILIIKIGLLGGVIAFVAGFWADGIIQVMATKSGIRASLRLLLPWEKIFRLTAICIFCALFLPFILTFQISALAQVLIGAASFFPAVGILLPTLKVVEVKEIRELWPKRKNFISSSDAIT